MVTERELLQAITECEKDPATPSKIEKLAHLYTVHNFLYGDRPIPEISQKADNVIHVSGNSDFLKSLNGKDSELVWKVLDEAMETIKLINPRLYDGILRRLN